jgi:hypothetical protein
VRAPGVAAVTRSRLDEFDRDLPRVLVAARKAGGVVVVDADGNTRFHLSIPHVALLNLVGRPPARATSQMMTRGQAASR